MKIKKTRIQHWTEETFCEYCGCPIMDRDAYYEIQDLEEFGFCSKPCAVDFLHNAEYEI